MIQRWKLVSVLLVATATAGSVVSIAQEKTTGGTPRPGHGDKTAGGNNTPVFEVKSGTLRAILTEPGTVEASRTQHVLCQAEGPTTIISIVPDGTKVKKGELVCELDSASLRDQLTNQKIATQVAEASYGNAKLTRAAAEAAVKEYEEGIYKQDMAAIEGEIKLAESDRARADDRRERTMRARKRLDDLLGAKEGERTAAEIVADLDVDDRLADTTRALSRARAALDAAKIKRDLLSYLTRLRRTMQLKSDVEKAKADELSKQSSWELARTKERKLERQIERCTLKAPADGIVVYANDPGRMGGQNQIQIEEGASVRERQKIFSVPDLGAPWLVNTKVRESMVDRIRPGLRVRVRVHRLPAEAIPGVVESIAPLPDPATSFRRDVKVYSTRVRLEKDSPGLRPGMSARVEMLVVDLDNALGIPLRAVMQIRGKHYVFLQPREGTTKREVKLGVSNDTMIEVNEGVRAGDKVALDPISLMSDAELREAFAVPKEGEVGDVSPAARKAERASPGYGSGGGPPDQHRER